MLYLVVAVAIIAALIFVPVLRRLITVTLTLAITLGATIAAIFGLAVLMNDISVNERPGMSARIKRFASVNWATTSDKGLGYLRCEDTEKNGGQIGEAAEKPEKPAAASTSRRKAGVAASPTPTPSATPAPSLGEAEDIYPELVQRGYPGITRDKLFKMSQESVSQLPGWKIIKPDEKTATLECEYQTRLFHWTDDVKIQVTPRSEIHICSHSRVGKGDFGANIAHIKAFYTALEPKVEEAYKEEERKQNAPPPARAR